MLDAIVEFEKKHTVREGIYFDKDDGKYKINHLCLRKNGKHDEFYEEYLKNVCIQLNYRFGVFLMGWNAKELKTPEQNPLSQSYVQIVSDKCDKILWRGRVRSIENCSTPILENDTLILVKQDWGTQWHRRHLSHLSVTDKGAFCYPDGLKSHQCKNTSYDLVHWDEWKPI